jgi:hypothetical protein
MKRFVGSMENWEVERNMEMKIIKEKNNFGNEIDFIFFGL